MYLDNLLTAAKCALADLEGIMPIFDPEHSHPGWQTIAELKTAIVELEYQRFYGAIFE